MALVLAPSSTCSSTIHAELYKNTKEKAEKGDIEIRKVYICPGCGTPGDKFVMFE